MRPKSEIFTPNRDDEHRCPFHMGVPPPGACRLDVTDMFAITNNYQLPIMKECLACELEIVAGENPFHQLKGDHSS